jgi:glycosyltransferase A (GT-A) superfamily protein (DUF2064 family)
MTSVIVLAKQPLPGRAKTRLTPPLSPQQAAAVAAGALADTLATAARTSAQARWLAFEGDANEWLPIGWQLTPERAAAAISGVPMSQVNTGELQLARLHGLGMRVQLLDELSDFDTFEVACAIVGQVPGGAFAQAMKEVRVAHA